MVEDACEKHMVSSHTSPRTVNPVSSPSARGLCGPLPVRRNWFVTATARPCIAAEMLSTEALRDAYSGSSHHFSPHVTEGGLWNTPEFV